MHIFVVAGEASGDLLAAGLIQELRCYYPNLHVIGITGPQMRQAGCITFLDMESISTMGVIEVIRHIPSLLIIRRKVIRYCLTEKPNLFIGIDAPDFNLNIEATLKKAGIKTAHYTSPSIWAWRPKRIHKIAKAVNIMLTLFPFEEPLYLKQGIKAHYVGHPLADQISLDSDKAAARSSLGIMPHAKLIGLLPGSRYHEIKYLAPVFLESAKQCLKSYPNLQFIVPVVNSARRQQFEMICQKMNYTLPLKVINGQARLVMAAADCLLIASGTATLEAMLLKRPMVVAYKIATLTYCLLKHKFKLKQFALPNILSNKILVPEFIQQDANPENLTKALLSYLPQPGLPNAILSEFEQIHQSLKKNADQQAAKAIYDLLNVNLA